VDKKIAQAEAILNYTFAEKALVAEAIQMAAPQAFLTFNGGRDIVNNNKQVTVLGDVVPAQALYKKWYQASPAMGTNAPPHKHKSALDNIPLFERGRELGIDTLILASLGYVGPATKSMVATTLEALFGATFLDGCESAVVAAVEHLGLDNRPSLMVTLQTHILLPHL
ncbi:hypothetical protein K458DRAFT_312550, partial [Lentithecium fluviatile CBS 122367]